MKGQATDHRTDIFSFGAILYEMLSGKRAFRGDSMAETMSAILREDPPTPQAIGGLFQISASGGTPHAVTTVDATKKERTQGWLYCYPDDVFAEY